MTHAERLRDSARIIKFKWVGDQPCRVALLAGADALDRQTPEPVSAKHRDGNWWLVWGDDRWLKCRWNRQWRNWEHSSGNRLSATPIYALPMPPAPEVEA